MRQPSLEWQKRTPVDGDPIWRTKPGKFYAIIDVACTCVFEWHVFMHPDVEVGMGSVYIEVEDEKWDYQCVEQVQVVAEDMLKALSETILGDLGTLRPVH